MATEEITIIRVDNAAYFIGDLFRQSFGDPPPEEPIHYVAFALVGPATFEAIGYYHVYHHGEYALMGGLCVDPRYRNHGLGERLVRITFEDAGEAKAFFAYAGNPISIRILHRAGYVDTRQEYMLVKWFQPLSEKEKEQMITAAIALGRF
jgi:ribosomal protein S18 acetylase RimI-like enzyme